MTWVLLLGALAVPAVSFAAAIERPIPKPLPDHPGNTFLAGEDVVVEMPPPKEEKGGAWRLTDYEGKTVSEGTATEGNAALGKLLVGYYELRRVVDGTPQKARVTVGVLAPLEAPTPLTSPICIDAAAAWFYPSGPRQEGAASLCALAGINWVRDRLAWREMEPKKGEFAANNKYDDTARKQAEARLQVLQVHHDSPPWANSNGKGKRFPLDLRDAYNFQKEMARRWKSQVLAFEPWNEADIDVFGGHTGAEMAALQKASYLGLKAGNPDVIVCLNVFASAQGPILNDLNDNQAWPYFDTFNLHHYCGPDGYPGVYAAFRAVSAGKPMWVSEFNAPVHWSGDKTEQEPSDPDLRVQAERVAQVYASSLHEGPVASFYFILGHYVEGQTQFGVIHKDLTPRPAFLAVAAAGRLLADAKPLGRWRAAGNVRAFVFRARPGIEERDVLVAWTAGGEATLDAPAAPVALFDYLGRRLPGAAAALKLSTAPLFAVFEKDTFKPAAVEAPPKAPPLKTGKPSPVVLQALWPKNKVALGQSAYRVSSEKAETMQVFAYNFGAEKAQGKLRVTAPQGWTVELPEQVELAPGERKELALKLDCQQGSSALTQVVRINGDFGAMGEAMLSVRLMPQPPKLREGAVLAMPGADDPARWQPMVSGGSELKIAGADGGGVLVTATLGPGDRWVYPILALQEGERPTPGYGALRFSITCVEGQATFRAIFDEENGSSYVGDLTVQPKPGETVDGLVVLSSTMHGTGWSKPDDNGKLDADKVRSIKIGCNTQGEKVKFAFKNVRWVKLK
ncbi:MAG: hypothetical protein NTW87_17805 [Planctomycetota bacterium]|nr:hypothetical protein [Planctomycetota bacterium]